MTFGPAADFHTVDPQSHFAVDGADIIMIPLAYSLGQALRWKAAAAGWLSDDIFCAVFFGVSDFRGKGLHACAACGKHIAVAGKPIRRFAAVLFPVGFVAEIQHLSLIHI